MRHGQFKRYERKSSIGAAVRVDVAQDPEGLSSIRMPECAASIWHRTPLPSFQSWIDHLTPEQLPRARVLLRVGTVRDALAEFMDVCETPECPERDMLVDDVAALATIFAKIMRAPYLRLRLDVVTNNSCRKFHMDAVTARLICTYRGTGTQYGIARYGDDPERVFTTPTCAPIVLKGAHWTEKSASRLLHRSPPIEGTGETRLVLVLDPVIDPDAQPEVRLPTRH
jgi:hypothetical protein